MRVCTPAMVHQVADPALGVSGKIALVHLGRTSLSQVLANAAANGAVAETSNWFRSAKRSDNELHVLPVLLPTYGLEVDDYNLAAAVADFRVRFGAVGQRDYVAGELSAGRAWVSLNDGATWTETPVARDGSVSWRLSIIRGMPEVMCCSVWT